MMPENASKFLFLGALMIIAVAVYGLPGGIAKRNDISPYPASALKAQVPLLVLPGQKLTADALEAAKPATGDAPAAAAQDSITQTTAGGSVRAAGSANTISSSDLPPQTGAEAELVENLATGEIYASLGTSKRWPLASLTKLMTAVVALGHFNPSDAITVGPDELAFTNETSGVQGRYTVRDLLNVMLVASRNEVAESFADSYGRDRFIALMNEQAAEWGMEDTHYDDASGLSAASESTVSDLQKLAAHISEEYPQIWAITKQSSRTITDLDTGKTETYPATNIFAGETEFLGGKTGFTDEADGNLVSLFNYRGSTVLIVVFGTDDRFGDTSKLYAWYKNIVS